MTVLLTLAGVSLIGMALRDIFQTLFHPGGGSGVLSSAVASGLWRALRFCAGPRPSVLQLGGPLGFFAVLVIWVVLFVVGWALIYLPHFPERFVFATGTPASARSGFVDAFYFSMASLTTLGYGDITPTNGWLRLLSPLESLVGFGVLTAAVSWLLSVYPALFQRRSFADEIALVYETERRTDRPVPQWNSEVVERMLGDFTSSLVSVRGSFLEFPVVYYFQGRDEQTELPAMMPYLLGLCERVRCASNQTSELHMQATMLGDAIDRFALTLGQRFLNLPEASTEEIIKAYARDHLHEPQVGLPPKEGGV